MSNIRDFTGKNRVMTGTSGTKIQSGTTAQRVDDTARLRFNNENNLLEYYTGAEWKSIDAPPTVQSITPSDMASIGDTNVSFAITGTGFASGATVTFEGVNGSFGSIVASSVTVNSVTSITAVAPRSSFLEADDPYNVKVTNVSGLSASLAEGLTVNSAPSFSVPSGSLYTGYDNTSVGTISTGATDVEGDSITFTITSGSLPSGLSLNSSSGDITGTPNTSETSATTYNFTLTATDTASNQVTRDYSITIAALPAGGTITTPTISSTNYRVHTFTSDGTWTVYGTTSQVDALVVAGGGSAGARHGGGAGAGGVLYITGATIAAGSYSASIGDGGGRSGDEQYGAPGQNTTFLGETADGGGRTNAYTGACLTQNGGSGGGESGRNCNLVGSATQGNPSQYSGTGYGNGGGATNTTSKHFGGGGGGAGAAGQTSNSNSMRTSDGGAGIQINIDGNNYYWGGGGGGNGYSNGQGGQAGFGGAGGGGAGGRTNGGNASGGGSALNSGGANSGDQGGNGGANTGGGGGAGSQTGPGRGGSGGRGIVIVRYPT